jgi:hypothetical protein
VGFGVQYTFTLSVGGLLAIGLSSCSRESSGYDDCILKNVKQGMNEAAVRVVTQACAEKFVQPAQQEVLKRPELASLDGRAGLDYGNHFSGTLYNGLSNRTITELEITVTTTIGGASTSRAYVTNVSIGPKSAGDFGFDIVVGDSGATYDWNVTGAKAVR